MMSCLTVRFTSAPSPSHTPLPCPGGPNSQKARKAEALTAVMAVAKEQGTVMIEAKGQGTVKAEQRHEAL